MKTYPINLVNLENKRCLVIGGGRIAERRVTGLVAAGTRPIVIGSQLTPSLAILHTKGLIDHVSRPFHADDLGGAFLLIVATDDTQLNKRIGRLAESQVPLVNVVDAPDLCNFIAPSVLRQGDFVVSISSGGAAPVLAARVRNEMESQYGPEYATFTAWCAAIRPFMKRAFPDQAERTARWYELVDSPVLDLLATGRVSEARVLVAQILGTQVAKHIPLPQEGFGDDKN